jgi:adenylate cyclase
MSGERYTFEGWTLDCERGALTSQNGDIALRPKSFEVLRFMIENAGRLLSRNEMLNVVWPGITVTEESLTKCVSEARNALGDSEQRIIKTVPKRGYVFAASVSRERRRERDAIERSKTARLYAPTQTDLTSTIYRLPDGPSVAVLPFANLSGDVCQEYLSDGITEDVINGLSYFSDLSVIARNSSASYKGRAIDVREVGRQLGIRYIVEGSVHRIGDRIRIAAQLVDAQSGVRRWAERFDRVLGDVFAVYDEIAHSIVRIVVAHVGKAEGERVSRKAPSSWTAHDLIMQGDQVMRAYEQSWTAPPLYEARRLYSEALKIDSDSARVCTKLALTYLRAYAEPSVQDFANPMVLEQGYELAGKAISLDPNLPMARGHLGWALMWMRQLDAAIQEYETAIALNPNFSDIRFANVLQYAGLPARALEIQQAHLRLDPFHPPMLHAFQGHALYMLKRYPEAAAALRECIRRGPHVLLGPVWLAATLVRLEQRSEARVIAAEVVRRSAGNYTIARWPALSLYRNSEDAEDMIEALQQAGLS